MSTPGGHEEGESPLEGGFHAANERDAEEEILFQQFVQERAARKEAEEQRRRQQQEQEAQARAAARRAEDERAAAEVARLAAAVAADRAEFARVSLGSARVLLLGANINEPNRRCPTVCATLLAVALSMGFQSDVSSRVPTWMLVRTAAADLTDDQQHQLRKAIGTAIKSSHIHYCSCA